MNYFSKYFFKISLFAIVFASLTFTIFTSNAIAGDSFKRAMKSSSSALRAQSKRMEIVAENIANSENTGINPNEDPYRRKTIYFESTKDSDSGAGIVKVRRYDVDRSEFKKVYRPEHPAADAEGYVKLPNVERSLESMDMRAAQRAYEANISVIETTKQMMNRTLDLMR